MHPRSKTLAFAAGGIVAFGGAAFAFWKLRHAPPPPIRAETPVASAAGPVDVNPPEATPDPAQTASAPEMPSAPGCDALHMANQEAIRRYEQRAKPPCRVEHPDLGCVTTPTGVTWGYRIASIHTEDADAGHEKDPCDTSVDVEVVRQDPTGTKVVPGANETVRYRYKEQNVLSLEALTDYDGDGEIELFRGHEVPLKKEASDQYEATVLTFRGGNLMPYPPARGLRFVVTRDIDGDGRLDLLTSGPYLGIGPNSHSGGMEIVPAIFAYHSLPDGTFALDDHAAIAFTRSSCPSATKEISINMDEIMYGSSDLAEDLVCARLRSVSPKKIVQAWDALCKDVDSGEARPCQTWPKDIAAVTPPFKLR